MKVNENTHVYCTNCTSFKLLKEVAYDNEGYEYTPDCEHKEECNLYDCCDSKPFHMRPWYTEK